MSEPKAKDVYEFRLLSETACSDDLFEDKTHERVAKTLCDLIVKHEGKGQTVGLEGPWGSGKSTVVTILKKKLEEAKCLFFYFDAWAHEGDPLRRIFLESLIDKLGDQAKELSKLKDQISNRAQTTTTQTTRSVTRLGKWIAFSAIFVPLGSGIISAIDYSEVTFDNAYPIHVPLVVGGILALMPLAVLFLNLIWLLLNKVFKKSNDLFKPEQWAFLESDSQSELTQEVSEENDRSSIEFERYFGEIMKCLHSRTPEQKFVIVLDNLDRINASDSLRIWATLQTFVQHKNPVGSSESWLEHVWVVVPYDRSGLAKLWQGADGQKGCECEFFDKCFQLRLEVPRPILTGWQHYAKDMINTALVGWSEEDKVDALDTLQRMRSLLSDIPTPRNIKTYIDQIGVLRQQAEATISTKAVCYYVIIRYLKNGGLSVDDIRRELEVGKIPFAVDRDNLPYSCNQDLAGLVFGVSPEKGQQLLLQPVIEDNLKNGNGDKLRDLVDKHGEGFWAVFRHHMVIASSTQFPMAYSKAVYCGLWKSYKGKCQLFVEKAKHVVIAFPSESTIEVYEAHLNLLTEAGVKLNQQWKQLIDGLTPILQKNETNNVPAIVALLNRCVTCFDSYVITSRPIANVTVQRWIEWANSASDQNIPAYLWVKPQNHIIAELASQVEPGKPVAKGVADTLSYLLMAGEEGCGPIVNACSVHLQHAYRPNQRSVCSPLIFEMLCWIAFRDSSCRDQVNQLIRTGQFQHGVFQTCSSDLALMVYASSLVARCCGKELHTVSIPRFQNSENGIQCVRQFWVAGSADNARRVWDLLKKHGQLGLFWTLAEDGRNKLMTDVISIAIQEVDSDFFSGPDAIHRLSLAFGFIGRTDDAKCRALVDHFIEHSDLENEVKKAASAYSSESDYMLSLLAKQTKDMALINAFAERIGGLGREPWDAALVNDESCLIPLALTIREKKEDFTLANNLLDALVDFAGKWARKEVVPKKERVGEWRMIVKLLGNPFLKRYVERIDECMANAKLIVAKTFFDANKGFMDLANLAVKEHESVESAVEQCVKHRDLEGLEIQDAILGSETEARFVPDDHMVVVLREPLVALYSSLNDTGHRALVERIAARFRVDLKAPTATT